MVCYFGLAIVGAVLFVSSALGDDLVATLLPTKLPMPMRSMAPYYDGESDFIYLFGGTNSTTLLNSILRFDIYTETIDEVAWLPKPTFACPIEAGLNGNLFYFDGSRAPYGIYKYDNYSVTTVGELGERPLYSASTKNSAGNVLLVGGSLGTAIMEININSENVQGNIVGRFPEIYSSAAAVKVTNNTALIFGSDGNYPYLELDLTTLVAREFAQASFPKFQYGMTVTRDLSNVYIFGGELTEAGVPAGGIIRLDPTAHAWDILQVHNFPVNSDDNFLFAPEVIWVEKLNRIYTFGGQLLKTSGEYLSYLDDIYYIDMNPLSPTSTPPTMTTTEEPASTTLDPLLFSCDDRIDGTHPHPSDCSKYIACRNGTLEGVHPCFPPLLYDPVTGNCNIPSLVDCKLSCEDKEDGTYPHPHDCGLFIICFNRDILVSWCDPPLLFDPQTLRCTLPELVQCSNL